jgi:hypothetical protein
MKAGKSYKLAKEKDSERKRNTLAQEKALRREKLVATGNITRRGRVSGNG